MPKIILKNVTDIEAFALISLLTFLYTILATLIFQFLSQFFVNIQASATGHVLNAKSPSF